VVYWEWQWIYWQHSFIKTDPRRTMGLFTQREGTWWKGEMLTCKEAEMSVLEKEFWKKAGENGTGSQVK
jgi:hypothetical protein